MEDGVGKKNSNDSFAYSNSQKDEDKDNGGLSESSGYSNSLGRQVRETKTNSSYLKNTKDVKGDVKRLHERKVDVKSNELIKDKEFVKTAIELKKAKLNFMYRNSALVKVSKDIVSGEREMPEKFPYRIFFRDSTGKKIYVIPVLATSNPKYQNIKQQLLVKLSQVEGESDLYEKAVTWYQSVCHKMASKYGEDSLKIKLNRKDSFLLSELSIREPEGGGPLNVDKHKDGMPEFFVEENDGELDEDDVQEEIVFDVNVEGEGSEDDTNVKGRNSQNVSNEARMHERSGGGYRSHDGALGSMGTSAINDTPQLELPAYVKVSNLPEEGNTGFSAVFNRDRAGGEAIGSVNAGDNELYIGGSGINKQFGKELGVVDADLEGQDYFQVHSQLLGKAGIENIITTSSGALQGLESGVCDATAMHRCLSGKEGQKDGSVCISVWSKDKVPHGDESNRAMIYVVPPNVQDFDTTQDFLNAVEDTASGLVNTLQHHNVIRLKRNEHDLVIPVLRLCGFSSDSYSDSAKVHPSQVHASIQKGLTKAICSIQEEECTIKEVQIPFSMQKKNSSEDLIKRSLARAFFFMQNKKVSEVDRYITTVQQLMPFDSFKIFIGVLYQELQKAKGSEHYNLFFSLLERHKKNCEAGSDNKHKKTDASVGDVISPKNMGLSHNDTGFDGGFDEDGESNGGFDETSVKKTGVESTTNQIVSDDDNDDDDDDDDTFGDDHPLNSLAEFEQIIAGQREDGVKLYSKQIRQQAELAWKKDAKNSEAVHPYSMLVLSKADREGYNLFHKLALVNEGSKQKIKYFSKPKYMQYMDIDKKSNDGLTPLQLSALKGYLQGAEGLLLCGADPNIPIQNGQNSLFLIDCLLEQSKRPEYFDKNDREDFGHLMLSLIEHGASKSRKIDEYMKAVTTISKFLDKQQIAEKKGKLPKVANLFKSPLQSHLEKVQKSIKSAKFVQNVSQQKIASERNKNWSKALQPQLVYSLCQSNKTEELKTLLKNNPNIDLTGGDGRLLHVACLRENYEIASILLNHGVNKNIKSFGNGMFHSIMTRKGKPGDLDSLENKKKLINLMLENNIKPKPGEIPSIVEFLGESLSQGSSQALKSQSKEYDMNPDSSKMKPKQSPKPSVQKSEIDKQYYYKAIMGQYPYKKYVNDTDRKSHIAFDDKNTEYNQLTNFYKPVNKLLIDGDRWSTIEHYFQASKFEPHSNEWETIRNIEDPKQLFNYAQQNMNKMKLALNEWEAGKDRVMLKALKCKADQVPEFREKLLATGEKPLFDLSSTDSYWGVAKHQKIDVYGDNTLGAMLMSLREHLKNNIQKE